MLVKLNDPKESMAPSTSVVGGKDFPPMKSHTTGDFPKLEESFEAKNEANSKRQDAHYVNWVPGEVEAWMQLRVHNVC